MCQRPSVAAWWDKNPSSTGTQNFLSFFFFPQVLYFKQTILIWQAPYKSNYHLELQEDCSTLMNNKMHWNVLGLLFHPWQIIKKGTWHWKCLIFLQSNSTCPTFASTSTTLTKRVFLFHFQIVIVGRFCNFQQFICPRVTFWVDRIHGETSRVKAETLFVSCWVHV